MSSNLTTTGGNPIADNQNSLSAGARGPLLIQDYQLLEKLAHQNRERVPERTVHAKGSGAYGTFTVTPGANNTGTGVIGSTSVTNLSATGTSQPYAGQSFTINFTSAYNTATSSSTYQILTVPATVPTPTGTYTSGQPISYGGVQINLTGAPAYTAATVGPPATPAVGDSFAVGPSTNQSVFTTMQNLITALQVPSTSAAGKAQLNNSIAAALNGLNAAITNTGTIEAQVGGRLNSITTAQSVATSQQLQLKTSISSLQSLDYTSAATMLTAEQTQLSAAMESFTLTQGLTLFKYIS